MRPDQTENEFVEELLDGLKEPPAYFPSMVIGNIKGVGSMDDVRSRGNTSLSPGAFEAATEQEGLIVLDSRTPAEFEKGFVPGSFNIDLGGSFAIWVGTVLRDINTPLLLVTPKGKKEETLIRLARVGFDGVIGFLEGGFEAWKAAGKAIDTIPTVNAAELATKGDVNILDVRKESEFYSEHVIGAVNAPLDNWWDSMSVIDPTKEYYVHCKSGNRSSIFCSVLRSKGFTNLINVNQGLEDIKATGEVKVSDYVCPSTML